MRLAACVLALGAVGCEPALVPASIAYLNPPQCRVELWSDLGNVDEITDGYVECPGDAPALNFATVRTDYPLAPALEAEMFPDGRGTVSALVPEAFTQRCAEGCFFRSRFDGYLQCIAGTWRRVREPLGRAKES